MEKPTRTTDGVDLTSNGTSESSSSRSNRATSSPPFNDPPNTIHTVQLFNIPIVALSIDQRLRLCLAQISSTLLKTFSYNEIHNRRVALGINCIQCTPVQLEILRRAGAMPISSRRCGMITKREAERLVKSFLCETKPPSLPDDFAFEVEHNCSWGCKGKFLPSRYNSSRAKCIQCVHCQQHFSPNKFIFHSHKLPESSFSPADAANFNSWRRHTHLTGKHLSDDLVHAWEDVKAMFNGGSRRRIVSPSVSVKKHIRPRFPSPLRSVAPKMNPNQQGGSSDVQLTQPAPQGLLTYPSSLVHPVSLLHYEWMYRQQPPFGPYNWWMQRAMQGTPTEAGWPWPNLNGILGDRPSTGGHSLRSLAVSTEGLPLTTPAD